MLQLTNSVMRKSLSLSLSGCSVCCRWCVCVCQQTASGTQFQSVCLSSRLCPTSRRWLSSSSFSTVRLTAPLLHLLNIMSVLPLRFVVLFFRRKFASDIYSVRVSARWVFAAAGCEQCLIFFFISSDPCVFLKLFQFIRTRGDNRATHTDWIQLDLQVTHTHKRCR